MDQHRAAVGHGLVGPGSAIVLDVILETGETALDGFVVCREILPEGQQAIDKIGPVIAVTNSAGGWRALLSALCLLLPLVAATSGAKNSEVFIGLAAAVFVVGNVVVAGPIAVHATVARDVIGPAGSEAFGEIARVGPIRRQATRVSEMLSDPARTGYLAVALPDLRGRVPVGHRQRLGPLGLQRRHALGLAPSARRHQAASPLAPHHAPRRLC